jgi:hypothetical protein
MPQENIHNPDIKQGAQESGSMFEFAGNRSASPPPFQLQSKLASPESGPIAADSSLSAVNAEGGNILSDEEVEAALYFHSARSEEFNRWVVKELQTNLGMESSGELDAATIQALAEFQKANKLTVNGKLDPYTLPKIFPHGLATTESQQAIVDDYLGINWKALTTTHQKMSAFLGLTNKHLVAAGVPKVIGGPAPQENSAANFDFKTWKINFNKEIVEKHTKDTAGLDRMLEICIHEARHAEQFFNIAQRLAGFDLPVSEIMTYSKVPIEIATAALSSPIKDGSAKSLVASEWHGSYFGSESSHRNKTHKNYQAEQSPENVQAVKSLPEEADAYRVMDELKILLQETRSK